MNHEVAVILPRHFREVWVTELIGKLIYYGIDFIIADHPVTATKACLVEQELPPEALAEVSCPCYRLAAPGETVEPGAFAGHVNNLLEGILFDAAATLHHAGARSQLVARSDSELMRQLLQEARRELPSRWFDATRYDLAVLWEGGRQLKMWEAASQEELAAHVEKMFAEESFDGSDCDQISPLYVILEMAMELVRPEWITETGRRLEYYWQITPRCQGALVSFAALSRTVRSEPLLQALTVMARFGRITGTELWRDRAMEQYRTIHKLLWDPTAQMLRHGRNATGYTASFWCRGQAMGCWAAMLLWEEMAGRETDRRQLETDFAAMAAGMLDLQRPDGFWDGVPGVCGSGEDASGTAWLAGVFLRGMRHKLLPRAIFDIPVRTAVDAVKSRIFEGRYIGMATGTTVSGRSEYYSKNLYNYHGWAHFGALALLEKLRWNQGKEM